MIQYYKKIYQYNSLRSKLVGENQMIDLLRVRPLLQSRPSKFAFYKVIVSRQFPSTSGHISFRVTGNGEKSESAGYPTGQQTTMPITPQGSPAQLKESTI